MAGSELIMIFLTMTIAIMLILLGVDLIRIRQSEKRYNKYMDNTNIEWKNGKPTLIQKTYEETYYNNDERPDEGV